MKNFETYAQYYDLLYKDKDYRLEVDYVLNLIKRYNKEATDILNLGCGTGRHDSFFKEMEFRIDGVDMSSDMIRVANSNNTSPNLGEYFHGDVRKWCHPKQKKYDCILSLFHVMSYQTSNKDVYDTLKTVDKHLNHDGVFIFDFWYGPAVYHLKPENKLKIVEDSKLKIIRATSSNFDYNNCCVNVNFNVCVVDKLENKLIEVFSEDHLMRSFFLNELSALLLNQNFLIVDSFAWLTLNRPSNESWSVISICKRK